MIRVTMTVTRCLGDATTGEGRATAAGKRRARIARGSVVASFAGMPGPLRGPHHLAHESLWTLGATVAVLDAPAPPNSQLVITRGHYDASAETFAGMAFEALKSREK